jgi:beta-galactosidase
MKKQSFDLGWKYAEGSGMFATLSAQWQSVNLPHDAAIHKPRSQNAPSGGGGGYAWGGALTYKKRFQIPQEWRGQSVQLEFEGVYMNAEVSINGNLVALHPYGYTGFVVDLTPYIQYGEHNDLTVVANNSAQPNTRWYSGTGIYRHVWLRTGGTPYIKPWGVFVTTPVVDPAASIVKVATELSGTGANAVLRVTILDARGTKVAQAETPVTGEVVEQILTVENAQLWSIGSPNLYTMASEVLVGGSVVDSEYTTFGIRSIEVDAEHGFRLNGVPVKLKGGCVHHDHGPLGAASYDRAEERRVQLLQASGFNAIRCAHNPPAPAMLDACDRLGMLVIDESFDCWRMGKVANDYHLYFEKYWQQDTASMVRRDRNHPSVIMWSIGNEVPERTGISDGYAWARRQAELVRALDPTRLVTSALPFLFEEMFAGTDTNDQPQAENIADSQTMFDPERLRPMDPATDRWGILTREFNTVLDVVGYNYLYPRYDWDGKHFAGRVIAGTETFPLQAYAFWKETERHLYVIGDFVWTAWDYLGESGIGKVDVDTYLPSFVADVWPFHLANCGDLDICGNKRPQSYFRDLLWGVRTTPYIGVLEPQLYGKKLKFSPWGWDPVIDSWTFPGDEGKLVQVHVYALDDQVELFVNGVSHGRKPAGDVQKYKAVFDVTYQPGTIEVVGYTGGQETGRTRLLTTGAPVALRATADRTEIHCAYGDLAYVSVDIVDQDGQVVKYAENAISVEVSGAGDLIALGTPNPISEELYVGTQRKAWKGSLLAVVRSDDQPGEIALTARSEGLSPAQVKLQAVS